MIYHKNYVFLTWEDTRTTNVNERTLNKRDSNTNWLNLSCYWIRPSSPHHRIVHHTKGIIPKRWNDVWQLLMFCLIFLLASAGYSYLVSASRKDLNFIRRQKNLRRWSRMCLATVSPCCYRHEGLNSLFFFFFNIYFVWGANLYFKTTFLPSVK